VTFMLENLDDALQLSMRVENVARDVGAADADAGTAGMSCVARLVGLTMSAVIFAGILTSVHFSAG